MIRDWLPWMFAGLLRPARSEPAPLIEKREPVVFSERQLERLRERDEARLRQAKVFEAATPPAFALSPTGEPPTKFANDDALGGFASWADSIDGAAWGDFPVWLGFQYLAVLAQRPENRLIVELFADEMTRKWIVLKSTGDEDKTDKIAKLEDAMKRFRLRDAFRNAKRDDGYFGMGQLYVDIEGVRDQPDLLVTPLILDKRTIKPGSLRGFRKIEPYWIYPQTYNAQDPLREDFFKPTAWTVFGKTIHATRMLTFIGNPVPDILKPAYSFAGISITQLMKPYVDAFIETKAGVNRLINAFSHMILSTNMAAYLNMNASKTLDERVEAFNLYRNNFDTMVVDKETEDLKNIAVPLSGLDELQAQAEEHMLIPSRTPLMKAFGLSPAGLGQSQDNEIRSFYDNVTADQEDEYRVPLEIALKVIQLSEFGEIDPDITFDFVPLWQLDEAGQIAVEKEKSDIRLQDIESGQVSPEEARQSIIADKNSIYQNLDEGEAPGTQDVDGEGKPLHDPMENEVGRQSEAAGGGAGRGASSGV